MFEDGKDFWSRALSLTTSVLMLDTPRRTIYGIIFGIFIQILGEVLVWLGVDIPKLSAFQYVIIGVVVLHVRTITSMMFKKRQLSEKYEEQFAVINEAEKRGLSKAHIKIQLLQVCQQALKDATLENAVKKELQSFEEKSKDD